jgi:hypothetical protein
VNNFITGLHISSQEGHLGLLLILIKFGDDIVFTEEKKI